MKKSILLTAVASTLIAFAVVATAAPVGIVAPSPIGTAVPTQPVPLGITPSTQHSPNNGSANAATPAQPNGAGLAVTPALPGNPVATAQVQMNRPVIQAPNVERPTVERPTVERPTVERPTVERPTVERPTIEKPTFSR